MDARHVDWLAVIAAAGRSRRSALRLLGLSAAALGMARVGTEVAAAKDDRRCGGKKTRNNTRCLAFACAPGCVCTLTVAGERKCLDNFAAPEFCPTQDECDSDADCPQGTACAKVGGCCPERPGRNYCLEKCPA
jgi:hypothetical protein